MISVSMLEPTDIIQATDWCRPLYLASMSGGQGDGYSFKCQYSGAPENNTKWVRVKMVLGKCWIGATVKHYHAAMSPFGRAYEFVRGDIPKSHRLTKKEYS